MRTDIYSYFTKAYLRASGARLANFRGDDGVNFKHAKFHGAALQGADLRMVDFTLADLEEANLSGADLTGAFFYWTLLLSANLKGANLKEALIVKADLTGADLTGANLTDADLSYACLAHANLSHAVLDGCEVFARKQFKDLNYQTRLQVVTVGAGKSRNIIADKPGEGSGTRNVVITSAHLDSINLQGGPSARAPGADDNGSGSAGLLEIARVFRDQRSMHDLRLILFGGEEQGLFGSKRYVASLPESERRRSRAVVNMDMIGSLNSASRGVLLEGAPLSQTVIDGLAQAAATYTQLPVETSLNPFASDHVPFINAQIPAVLTIEGADNTNHRIHSANDTLDKIDYEIAQEILRMNIGFIASEIGSIS